MHEEAASGVAASPTGRRWPATGADAPRRGHRRVTPRLEPLEGRRLLSTYSGPSANRPVLTSAGTFTIQVTGPGVVEIQHAARGAIAIKAYGTTSNSAITITQTGQRYHAPSQLLPVQSLWIRSGQLGSLSAPTTELEGKMTPLDNSVNTFAIGTIGPKAQVTINGSVGSLSVSNIDLGPTGRVAIAGDVNTIAQGGSSTGLIPLVPPTASGTSTGTSTTQTGPMTIGDVTIDGGQFSIGRDSLESIAINGDVSINHDGSFSIGRDQDGSFTVNGSVLLSTGGHLVIGRNLGSLAVTGDLIVQPSGSGIAVDGALESLSVDGYFQGQGGLAPSAIDLGVGLNLSGLTVVGGISGQGGLVNANVRAGGTVSEVAIAYGTYNSAIESNASMPT